MCQTVLPFLLVLSALCSDPQTLKSVIYDTVHDISLPTSVTNNTEYYQDSPLKDIVLIALPI